MTDQISIFEQELRQEEEEAKKKAPRGKRSLDLIADFNEEGYAEGWYFAISNAFKDQLDIKYMERKEPVLDENGKVVREPFKDKKGNIILKKDGTPRMRRKTRAVMRWTQGKYYCFDEGHVLYDTPKAYSPLWKDALKHISFRCEIIRAAPNQIDSEGKFKGGYVTFTLSKPNRDRTALETVGQYHLTQNEFVEYLKTGELKEGAEDLKAGDLMA